MTTRRRKEWFDDDAFWQDVYPFLFPDMRFVDAVEQTNQIVALTRPAGRVLLDLCCGPGRHAIPFAQDGYAVTGVDRTKYFLNKARIRARRAGVAVEWVQADMRDFVRADTYDLALSLFTSFGYFDDKREDEAVLRHVLTSLRPGGACLIDMVGKERVARTLETTTSDVLSNGSMLVQRHEVFDDWTRIRNDWVVVRKGRAKNFSFHHTLYSGEELRTLMERVGFVEVELHGSFAGAPYDIHATRLVAVGRKPAGS
jgi:SAM-dependent methyltransferase